jgi:hypothetical protein
MEVNRYGDSHLDLPDRPAPVQRTSAHQQLCSVCRGDVRRLAVRFATGAKARERYRGGSQRSRVGSSRHLGTCGDNPAQINREQTDNRKNYDDGGRDHANRPGLLFHRSTRITAVADSGTVGPPISGNLTEWANRMVTLASAPTTWGR